MRSAIDEVVRYAPQLPWAALAAGPRVRRAAEWREVIAPHSEYAMSVERVAASSVAAKGLCLYMPPEVEEVVVVTVQGLARYGGAEAAAEASMWWVDRSLSGAGARLLCCLRLKELGAERLLLYSRADEDVPQHASTVRRLRVPGGDFTIQVSRLTELRALQFSPAVSRHVIELDVRSCLRWSQEEVNTTLTTITPPLRAVRVPTVSLAAVALLRRFHASLRVLHLCRRTVAVFHDPLALLPFEDEELEEEETRTDSSTVMMTATSAAPAVNALKAPPRVPAPRLAAVRPTTQRGKAAAAPAAATPTSGSTTVGAGRGAAPSRRSRLLLRLPPGVVPVLEELYITNSIRSRAPNWLSRCLHLRRLAISNSRYTTIAALRTLAALEEVSLESCPAFTGFSSLCHFPMLRVLTIKNCAQLRSIAWLPRLSGALVSLTLHHLAPAQLVAAEEAGVVGVGLDYLAVLHLSVPGLRHLRPLLVHAAATLRELTLFTCINVDDFADLPALPSLEKLTITGNRHIQTFVWLSGSPLLTEVRATQCTQLLSVSGLEKCPQLRMLDLTGAAQLQNIRDVVACTALTYVDLSQCLSLTSVAGLRHLPRLRCAMMRNCARLSKNFEWLAGCACLTELVLPSAAWFDAASEALQQLNRWGMVVLR